MKRVLIKGATVVDGTGAPSYSGSVLVAGERIEAVFPAGTEPTAEFDATIDATGCLVTPGFVDAHAHSDAYLVLEPSAPSKLTQGVTTEINGQCGGSAAPRYGEARLSSDWAAVLGERLTWRSFAEYRATLEAAKPAVNTVQFVGHNTLRSSVVGYAGRAATPDEVKAMQRLLAESLAAGAKGLTTGLIYQPGRYSTPEEVTALAQTAADAGGLYATHMRSEGDRILEAIDEVLALVDRTGIRAEISHLKTAGSANWSKIDAVLEKVGGAVAEGRLLGSDRYPFTAAGTDLDVVLSDWAQEGAALAETKRLADPALRARIVAELDALDRDWTTVMIGGTWSAETKRFSGLSVAACATLLSGEAGRPVTPGETVARILAADGCKTGAFFFGMSEANLDRILACPWIVPGSDASLRAPWGPLGADHPHPRAYATMPEFYRRLRALGIGREAAVARMTSVPADRFGLAHRGRIVAGAYADLAVWDEAAFKGQATYVKPHQYAAGVKAVFVNGCLTYVDGAFTGERAGRML